MRQDFGTTPTPSPEVGCPKTEVHAPACSPPVHGPTEFEPPHQDLITHHPSSAIIIHNHL